MKQLTSMKLPLISVTLLCLLASGFALAQGDEVGIIIVNETEGSISIDQDAYEIGLHAYLYFYPLVTMDISRRQATNMEAGKVEGYGPMNSFSHMRSFPSANFTHVVRPNFDTLYSWAWLDLTDGPVIVSVPDTDGRYYLLQMLDMWTDTFAAPGKRTTGTDAGDFAIVPQCWNGRLPEGVTRIDAPTPYVSVAGRTQTNGVADYETVHRIQDGYRITPLDQWGEVPQQSNVTIDPSIDMATPALVQVNSMNASEYFTYAAELMKVNPPHITDQPIIARMKRIGIEPGRSLDFENLHPTVQQALEESAKGGLKEMIDRSPTMGKIVNGWLMSTDSVGVYGSNYLKRAITAMTSLGANLPEDAIYLKMLSDADGSFLDGNNTYLLRFNESEIPPADAFWSVTMYDDMGFPVANSMNRYALGDRDDLFYNEDGSLDIYMQNESPSIDKEHNWLPAPQGPFTLSMRIYLPKREALDCTWSPPLIKKVE